MLFTYLLTLSDLKWIFYMIMVQVASVKSAVLCFCLILVVCIVI